MFTGIGGLVTENTLTILHAVHALGCRDLYFVDVTHWRQALGGMTAAVLIPILCVVHYGYAVSIPLSGVVDMDLYGELVKAIHGMSVPRMISPLNWSFRDIVAAYNNIPELDELYSFRESIVPFPLGNGRRVLLSALYLLIRGASIDTTSWGNAYAALQH